MPPEQLTASAVHGLTQLQQLGLAGVMLSFLIIFGGLAIWYLSKQNERCAQAAIASQNQNLKVLLDEMEKSRAVITNNTTAFLGVQVTLARIEGKIGINSNG